MSVDLKQYDDWVIKNQKDVLDWVKKYSTASYASVRDAFQNYHRANSKWKRIEAFEDIKNSLKNPEGVKFTDRLEERFEPARANLQRLADKHTGGDIDSLWTQYSPNKDMQTYERYKDLYKSLSTIPEKVDKYENLELDRAYQDQYDYKAMKALADKYNYDYTDPKDRKEFLKHLSEMELQRLKNEAYTPNDAAGMLTQLAYPVSLEHARKTDEISGPAIATDLVSQAAMMGAGGAAARGAVPAIGETGEIFANLVAAPIITEAGQVLVNDKDLGDAVKDAGVMAGTNMLAPGMVKGYGAMLTNPVKTTEKAGAQRLVNKLVNESEQIRRAQLARTPYKVINSHEKEINEAVNKEFYKLVDEFREKYPNHTHEDYIRFAKAARPKVEQKVRAEFADQIKQEELGQLASNNTDIYRRNFFLRNKELNPKQVADVGNDVMNIGPEDQMNRQLRWKKQTKETNKQVAADKKFRQDLARAELNYKMIHNEPITANDLLRAGYSEGFLHSVFRNLGTAGSVVKNPITSIGTNLGATTRMTDRKIGSLGRNFNLPWKYGESQSKIDYDDPRIKAYIEAYGRYKGNKAYYSEPPKPKGLSEDEIKELQKKAPTISIMDIFGN